MDICVKLGFMYFLVEFSETINSLGSLFLGILNYRYRLYYPIHKIDYWFNLV